MKKEFSILHISDLHFSNANETDWKKIYKFLENDINETYEKENNNAIYNNPKLYKPDIVIVSGDISNNGREYDTALNFLNKIVQNILNNDYKKLILVPGNHDLDWEVSKQCYEGIDFNEENFNKSDKPDSGIRCQRINNNLILFKRKDELFYTRFNSFFDFFNNFYKGEILYPTSPLEEFIIYDLGKLLGIVIVGFNSCIEIDHLFNQPFVNQHAIISASEYIDKKDDLKNLMRIAVWHHGIIPHQGKIDFLEKNSMINLLLANKFSVLLHGHMHESQYQEGNSELNEIIPVIGAGSIGASYLHRPESIPFQYNLINIDLKNSFGYVHTRRQKSDTSPWLPDHIWAAGSQSYYKVKLPTSSTFCVNGDNTEKTNIKSEINMDFSNAPIIDLFNSINKDILINVTLKTIHDRFGLSDPRFIFGRNEDLIRIFRRILMDEENVCIQGPQWSGKTTLLQAIESKLIHAWVKDHHKINYNFDNSFFIYLDLNNLQKPEEIFKEIAEKLSRYTNNYLTSSSLISILDYLEKSNKSMILLMDNFDHILEKDEFEKEFFNFMRAKSGERTLKIIYTSTTGRDFSIDARKKAHYFNAAGYPITYFLDKNINDYITIPLKFVGFDQLEEYLPRIKFLAGYHPFFLSIARKILYDLLIENIKTLSSKDIIIKLEEYLEGEVIRYYPSLLNNFNKTEHKLLYQQLSNDESSNIIGEKIRSLGKIENKEFIPFSEHFRKYYTEFYYPTNFV